MSKKIIKALKYGGHEWSLLTEMAELRGVTAISIIEDAITSLFVFDDIFSYKELVKQYGYELREIETFDNCFNVMVFNGDKEICLAYVMNNGKVTYATLFSEFKQRLEESV